MEKESSISEKEILKLAFIGDIEKVIKKFENSVESIYEKYPILSKSNNVRVRESIFESIEIDNKSYLVEDFIGCLGTALGDHRAVGVYEVLTDEGKFERECILITRLDNKPITLEEVNAVKKEYVNKITMLDKHKVFIKFFKDTLRNVEDSEDYTTIDKLSVLKSITSLMI